MKYDLFLFDLDDTLLDFTASEKRSFQLTLSQLGITSDIETLFSTYQVENKALWRLFEEAKTTKDFLKVERFRKTFLSHQIAADAEHASELYLNTLPSTVLLVDHAVELLHWLAPQGEIGIITNGIQSVQSQRIQNSGIAPFISFISVSDECGFAKPDVRFFEHTVKKAKTFSKEKCLIIGDREDADIQGAHNFGIDSCWFNPTGKAKPSPLSPTFEIKHLSELKAILS